MMEIIFPNNNSLENIFAENDFCDNILSRIYFPGNHFPKSSYFPGDKRNLNLNSKSEQSANMIQNKTLSYSVKSLII